MASKVNAQDILGIGIDFTSCTILPTKKDGTPLCMIEKYTHEPHAYVKLWKHHAAQYCADILNEKAYEMNEKWIDVYGGKISCEWLVPKSMQILKESPDVYNATDRIIEAGDWIVWQLCGKECRSSCNAGYKALWNYKDGYPSKDFFKSLDENMENFVAEKLSTEIFPIGSRAGFLTEAMAEKTGLSLKTAIAVGIIDAHSSVPACKINDANKMLIILGTSTCHMLLSKEEKPVLGSCGIVKDGILPGFFGYESGQSSVGDSFDWFIKNCVPFEYTNEAKEKNINIHKFLRNKAEKLEVGESGLVSLDWLGGARSTLMNSNLSGVLLGITTKTKSEEIYRALIESTAFGTRNIIDAFKIENVKIDSIYAAGGIASKDNMTMQIYADVCNKEIFISGSDQSAALGAAIFGAVASDKSGFSNVSEAILKLGKVKDISYKPIPENVKKYDLLYNYYKKMHDFFGIEQKEIMLNLKEMKTV